MWTGRTLGSSSVETARRSLPQPGAVGPRRSPRPLTLSSKGHSAPLLSQPLFPISPPGQPQCGGRDSAGQGWEQVMGLPLRGAQEAFAVSLILRWGGGSSPSGRRKDVPCSHSRTRAPGWAGPGQRRGGGGARGPPQPASGAGLRVLAHSTSVPAWGRGRGPPGAHPLALRLAATRLVWLRPGVPRAGPGQGARAEALLSDN